MAPAPEAVGAGRPGDEGEAMVKGELTGSRILAGILILGFATVARAGPGDGIRLGGTSGRLHPYLELEARYDTNIAYTDQAAATAGTILHVRPGLAFESPGDSAALDVKAQADWTQVLGENSDLSRLYGDAALGLGLNRKGSIGLEVGDAFRRSASTRVLNFGGAVVENNNSLQVAVPWRPGGGAFIVTPSGGWDVSTFEPFKRGALCTLPTPECDAAAMAEMGYSDVRAGLDLRWKFLPRTAVVLQGEYWKRLPADSTLGVKASGYRAWTGLAGLVTAHMATTIKGGYGHVSDAPGSMSSWLANVEGEWLPVETTGLKAGYIHDLGVDPGSDGGFTSHRAYLDGRALLAGRYLLHLSGSYEHRSYPSTGFAADLLTAEPSADVELTRWLRVGVGVAYTHRTSKLPTGTPALPGFAYNKTEAFVRLRGTY
jgi:hypothetical protein